MIRHAQGFGSKSAEICSSAFSAANCGKPFFGGEAFAQGLSFANSSPRILMARQRGFVESWHMTEGFLPYAMAARTAWRVRRKAFGCFG
jgi:hypothetical protein